MKNIVTIVFLISLFTACEEPFEWSLNNDTNGLLVVEAVITNENKQHEVQLSRTYPTQNIGADPVSGAIVIISDGDNTYSLQESAFVPGIYLTDSMRAVFGKVYTLYIESDNKQYFAYDVQAPGQPLEPLAYRKTDSINYALNFIPSGTDANYIVYSLNWQNLAACSNYQSCEALQIYYDLKTTDIHELFKPNQEVVNFPAGTQVVRRKYSVSEPYRNYLRGILSETNWRGGPFDVYPANPNTNLSEGAIGFFAVSTVAVDTLEILPLP